MVFGQEAKAGELVPARIGLHQRLQMLPFVPSVAHSPERRPARGPYLAGHGPRPPLHHPRRAFGVGPRQYDYRARPLQNGRDGRGTVAGQGRAGQPIGLHENIVVKGRSLRHQLLQLTGLRPQSHAGRGADGVEPAQGRCPVVPRAGQAVRQSRQALPQSRKRPQKTALW